MGSSTASVCNGMPDYGSWGFGGLPYMYSEGGGRGKIKVPWLFFSSAFHKFRHLLHLRGQMMVPPVLENHPNLEVVTLFLLRVV